MTVLAIALIAAYCLMMWVIGIGFVSQGFLEGGGVKPWRVAVAVLSPVVMIPCMAFASVQIIRDAYSEWRRFR